MGNPSADVRCGDGRFPDLGPGPTSPVAGLGRLKDVALNAAGPGDAVNHELRAWIKSLAARPTRREGESRAFSPEDAAYLRKIATDGTLKAALQEIAAGESDLAD